MAAAKSVAWTRSGARGWWMRGEIPATLGGAGSSLQFVGIASLADQHSDAKILRMSLVPVPLRIDVSDAAVAKVAQLFEGIFPCIVRRRSEAEADAKIIHARADARASEIKARAEFFLAKKKIGRQANLEEIAAKAMRMVPDTVSADSVDRDWFQHFLECAQDTSNEEMRLLWSKVLAGEISKPGSFSRRTVHLAKLLSVEDARAFSKICQYSFDEDWSRGECFFLYRPGDPDQDFDFDSLSALDATGLIVFAMGMQFSFACTPEQASLCHYHGRKIKPQFGLSSIVTNSALESSATGRMSLGSVAMTKFGRELSALVERQYDDKVWSHLTRWFGRSLEDQGAPAVR